MRYLCGSNLGPEIEKLEPTHIQVAYIGMDWKQFINHKKIEKIIVSPGYPTNPYALDDLISRVGRSKVRALDNLHAKVYLRIDGSCGKAIVGSPNLTANGLGGYGLYEAAVEFDFIVGSENEDGIHILDQFDDVWNNSEELSKYKVEELKDQYRAMQARKASNLDCDDDFPLLVWFQGADWETSDDAVESSGLSRDDFIDRIDNSLEIENQEDRIFLQKAKGRLVLLFHKNEDEWYWGRVTGRFIQKAFYYKDNPDQLIDVCLLNINNLDPPFDLDDPQFRQAFKELVNDETFDDLRTDKYRRWFTQSRLELMRRFCKKLYHSI